MNWPPTRPTRHAPSGPAHGISLTINAAEAPSKASISGSFSPSALSGMVWTWTSLYQPLVNSGRIGRSMMREVRISFSVGRPSLKIAAGEFARRCGFFTVIDREREEILAFLGLGRGD